MCRHCDTSGKSLMNQVVKSPMVLGASLQFSEPSVKGSAGQ